MSPTFRFYRGLLIRRAPVMLLLFAACAGLGLIAALRLPPTYASSANLLVQSQGISTSVAETTVDIEAIEAMELLTEQLLTRANLIEIAFDYQVFEDQNEMTPDDIVDAMRERARISIQAGPPALFLLNFEARDGQIAADVVNELITRITAANVRLRTGQAGDTLAFTEREVNRLNAELERRSARIAEFRSQNANALPEDQEFRLQRQALLQERIAATERERRALEETRTRTIQVFEATGSINAENLSPAETELRELEDALSGLLAIYSETAPQVLQLRRRISQLEQRIASQAPNLPPTEGGEPRESSGTPLLDLQLAEIDGRLANLDELIADTERELVVLEASISQTPLNAIQLEQLQRQFGTVEEQFLIAQSNLAQAAIGAQIEEGGAGQRIIILEPPVVPDNPASPNRPVIAAMGVFGGLALAGAFFMLLELLNSAVRRPQEITKALGITPLANIPYIESARRKFIRRSIRVALVLVVLAGIPTGLWVVHEYYQPLDILADQLLNRFGLV